MKHFSKPDGSIWAFELDGSQDHLIAQDMTYLAPQALADLRASVVAPPPVAVDMAQARLALLAAGHLATVNAAISAMTGSAGDAARIEWEFRARVRRDSALVAAMAAVLNLDSDALDALFTAAAAL